VRLVRSLAKVQPATARHLRALEFLLVRLYTRPGPGPRVLRSAVELEGLVAMLRLPELSSSGANAVQRYLEVADSALAQPNLQAFLAGGLLERARSIKYTPGVKYLEVGVIRSAIECLLILERVAIEPGFSDHPELELSDWPGHRLPIEPREGKGEGAARAARTAPVRPRSASDVTGVMALPSGFGALEAAGATSDGERTASRVTPGGTAVGGRKTGDRIESGGTEARTPPGRTAGETASRARSVGAAGEGGEASRSGARAAPVAARTDPDQELADQLARVIAGIPEPEGAGRSADRTPRETAARETAARESAARETAARESAARESAARESATGAPGHKESAALRPARVGHRTLNVETAAAPGAAGEPVPRDAAASGIRARLFLSAFTVTNLLVTVILGSRLLLDAPTRVVEDSSRYQVYQLTGTASSLPITSARRLDSTLMVLGSPDWEELSVSHRRSLIEHLTRALLGRDGIERVVVVDVQGQMLATGSRDAVEVPETAR